MASSDDPTATAHFERARALERTDWSQAATHFARASEGGHSSAHFALGCQYHAGWGVKQSDREAMMKWQAAANGGHSHAQSNVALMMLAGRGQPKDDERPSNRTSPSQSQADSDAADLLHLAAQGEGSDENNNANAAMNLASFYFWQRRKKAEDEDEDDDEDDTDLERVSLASPVKLPPPPPQLSPPSSFTVAAVQALRFAAHSDPTLSPAHYNLGVLHERQAAREGESAEGQRHTAEALKAYSRAAEPSSYPKALTNLGFMHARRGGNEGEAEAMDCFRRAAEQGEANAQANLGSLYYTAGDEAAAAHWWLKAATAGHVKGQLNLASLFLQGRGGLAEDEKEAARWLHRAAAQGSEQALRSLHALLADPAASSP
jgi:TPR repeat protein